MEKVLLETHELEYSYEDDRQALRGVSVSFHSGERTAVMGSNGAGKSTFFLLCNGVLEPRRGEVIFGGKPVGHKKAERMELRRRVGIVFQEADTQILAPTVEAEISFGPMNLGLSKEEVRRQVDGAVAEMELENFRDRAPHALSGGEKKRVTIADILAMEPQLILLDEPASSLDPKGSENLETTLKELSVRGIALAVATHDVDFAWRWAERILIFHEGKILADGRPQEIFSQKELVEQAGLRRPILWQVAEILQKSGQLREGQWPKTPQELKQIMEENR
ncbi:energy-coupling factor ABC transporter ATP-binding protein [Acidaminobacterium chupaoyuni]